MACAGLFSFFSDRGKGQTADLQTLGPADQVAIQHLVRLPAQLLRRVHIVHGPAPAGAVRPRADAGDVGGARAQDVHQGRQASVVEGLPASQVQVERLQGDPVGVPRRPREALLLQTVLRPAHRNAVVSIYTSYVQRVEILLGEGLGEGLG